MNARIVRYGRPSRELLSLSPHAHCLYSLVYTPWAGVLCRPRARRVRRYRSNRYPLRLCRTRNTDFVGTAPTTIICSTSLRLHLVLRLDSPLGRCLYTSRDSRAYRCICESPRAPSPAEHITRHPYRSEARSVGKMVRTDVGVVLSEANPSGGLYWGAQTPPRGSRSRLSSG